MAVVFALLRPASAPARCPVALLSLPLTLRASGGGAQGVVLVLRADQGAAHAQWPPRGYASFACSHNFLSRAYHGLGSSSSAGVARCAPHHGADPGQRLRTGRDHRHEFAALTRARPSMQAAWVPALDDAFSLWGSR